MKIKKLLLFVFYISSYAVLTLNGRSASSVNAFYRIINKAPFSVAFLYKSDSHLKKQNRALYNSIRDAQSSFKALKSVPLYKNADVSFVDVNTASNKLMTLPRDFNVSVYDNHPVYLLFKNGKMLNAHKNKDDFLTTTELRNFIDNHMMNYLEDYIEDKTLARAQEREREQSRVYFGYPWYGYYPYYGGLGYYPYGGGYGGRVGFGISFGI